MAVGFARPAIHFAADGVVEWVKVGRPFRDTAREVEEAARRLLRLRPAALPNRVNLYNPSGAAESPRPGEYAWPLSSYSMTSPVVRPTAVRSDLYMSQARSAHQPIWLSILYMKKTPREYETANTYFNVKDRPALLWEVG